MARTETAAALRRAVRVEQKRIAGLKLAELQRELRAARARKVEAINQAMAACRAARVKAAARRASALAELEGARHEVKEARATCGALEGDARSKAAADVSSAKERRDAEKRARAEQRRAEAAARGRKAPRASAHVRRTESDDEVRGNIPPELVRLFERVKRGIKGSARETRTEAFLRYAEEHPGEMYEAIEDQTDALIRELEARQWAQNPCGCRKGNPPELPRGPAPATAAERQAMADHKRFGWGEVMQGRMVNLLVPDADKGPFSTLGDAIGVIYGRHKGGDGRYTIYEHYFGDFGRAGERDSRAVMRRVRAGLMPLFVVDRERKLHIAERKGVKGYTVETEGVTG